MTEQTVKELCDVAALTVEIARKLGADHAEVLVRDGSELTAKVRLGEPELVQEAGSRALGLRVLKGAKRAVTYTSDLRRESLEALCKETVALADLAEADEYALPPDPALLAKELPDLDLYDPAVADVDAGWALRIVPNQLYYALSVPFVYFSAFGFRREGLLARGLQTPGERPR